MAEERLRIRLFKGGIGVVVLNDGYISPIFAIGNCSEFVIALTFRNRKNSALSTLIHNYKPE